ncbi:MAG TPA: polysaccharide biosynthesis protein [Bacillales bacterium]
MSASVWRGAMLLTGVGVAVKVMSAVYRIPYQNIAGDLGFYVYQQIYPFFAGAVFLATFGFPAAISKLVAARLADGDNGGASRIFTQSFFVLALFALFVFALLYGGAPWISEMMGDGRLTGPLRTVAFSFLFLPPVAVIRGFFQGNHSMMPTAVSQLFEQSVRVALIIGLTVYVALQGFGPYKAGAAAGIGSSAGMAAAAVILTLFAFRQRDLFSRKGSGIAFLPLLKILSYEGLAFSVTSLALVLFLFIDTFTVVPLLGTSLFEARVLMGVYDRGYPLVQLATAAAMSFSLAFVPAMARAKVQGDWKFVYEKSEFAVRLSAAFGMAAIVGFALLARPVNIMLFEDDSGSGTLAWFGVTMLFSMIVMTTAGILQAIGETRRTIHHTWIGLVLKLALNLCLIPWIGTLGAATATVLSFAVIAGLNGMALQRKTGAFSFLFAARLKLFVALFLMAASVYVWQFGMAQVFPVLDGRLFATVVALGGTAVGAAVYLFSLLRIGFFSKSELFSLSNAEKTRRSA